MPRRCAHRAGSRSRVSDCGVVYFFGKQFCLTTTHSAHFPLGFLCLNDGTRQTTQKKKTTQRSACETGRRRLCGASTWHTTNGGIGKESRNCTHRIAGILCYARVWIQWQVELDTCSFRLNVLSCQLAGTLDGWVWNELHAFLTCVLIHRAGPCSP